MIPSIYFIFIITSFIISHPIAFHISFSSSLILNNIKILNLLLKIICLSRKLNISSIYDSHQGSLNKLFPNLLYIITTINENIWLLAIIYPLDDAYPIGNATSQLSWIFNGTSDTRKKNISEILIITINGCFCSKINGRRII